MSASGRDGARGSGLLRLVAALGLLVGGWVHLCLYRQGYEYIPTIGTLFLVNVAASVVAATALLLRRSFVVRVGAALVCLGTLAAFVATRRPGGLFHFEERGLEPHPQALIAIGAETFALLILLVTFGFDRAARAVDPAAGPVPLSRR